jgi:hypothetical protein
MFGLASEMLLFSFSLPSSLCVLVNYLVVVKLHHLPMLLTLEFHRLLVLFADAMNIPYRLQILKVV